VGERSAARREDHFEDRRERRDNLRIPVLSELSGLMGSIFFPAFSTLPDFFDAIVAFSRSNVEALLRVPVHSSLQFVNCGESAKLSSSCRPRGTYHKSINMNPRRKNDEIGAMDFRSATPVPNEWVAPGAGSWAGD
jgi:hypothetical protein